MASTRNKNTPSDYCLQQRAYAQGRQETIYKHSAYGEAYSTKWAGNGLNPGQLPWNTMSKNAPDIESFLFGINSTNLVNPQPALTPKGVMTDIDARKQRIGGEIICKVF